MRNSDIFNGFAKIAQEKGIISNDSGKAAKELSKTHRADSLSISAIQALYGVKNEMPKAMSYDKNIMESAHANNVIISPAYDKLNSLFENNIERQNILLRIVNKNPDGLLTQRKYAKNDLILSLVRVANDLDNNDKDQLRALADSCLYSLKKEAFAHWGLVNLVAATMGIYYAFTHIKNSNTGFKDLHEDLIKQLEQLRDGEPTLGVGLKLTDAGKDIIDVVIKNLAPIKSTYDEVMPELFLAYTPRTNDQIVAEVNLHPARYRDLGKKYIKLKRSIENIKPFLAQLKYLFANKNMLYAMVEDEGVLTKLIENTQVLHGGYGLVPNDYDDVTNILPAYLESLEQLLKDMGRAESKAKALIDKPIESSMPQTNLGEPGESPTISNTSEEYHKLRDYWDKNHPAELPTPGKFEDLNP